MLDLALYVMTLSVLINIVTNGITSQTVQIEIIGLFLVAKVADISIASIEKRKKK